VALRAESEHAFDRKSLMDTVWSMVYKLFGEYGTSQTGLSLVKWDEGEGVLIARCSHKALDMVRAATAAITEINGKRAVVYVLGVSGTLKGLQRKLPRPRV
jgi:ribonuclease P/MRP protein subunit POP5